MCPLQPYYGIVNPADRETWRLALTTETQRCKGAFNHPIVLWSTEYGDPASCSLRFSTWVRLSRKDYRPLDVQWLGLRLPPRAGILSKSDSLVTRNPYCVPRCFQSWPMFKCIHAHAISETARTTGGLTVRTTTLARCPRSSSRIEHHL